VACWAEEDADAEDAIDRAEEVEVDAKEGDGGANANPTIGDGAAVAMRQATADAIRGLMMMY